MKLLPLLAATLSLSISVSASAQVTGKYISTVPGIRHSGVVTNMQTDGAPTLLTTGNKCPMVKMNSVAGLSLRLPKASAAYGLRVPSTPGSREKLIKASLISSEAWGSGTRFGMYSMPAQGGELKLLTSEEYFEYFDYVANGGGTAIGENSYYMTSYAYSPTPMGGVNVTAVMNVILNTEDWSVQGSQVQKDENGKPDIATISTAMACDPTTNLIYGTFYGSNPDLYTFGTYDINRFQLQPVAFIEEPWAACGFDTSGHLYALKKNGEFCSVDKNNGKETVIGDTGLKPYYDSTGAVNPDDNMFYYILCDDAGTSMYKIDLATGEAPSVYQFEHGEQLMGMYFSNPDPSDLAPAAPTGLSGMFAGQLSGQVSFTLPTTTIGGQSLTEQLDWTLECNYKPYKTGKGQPGETVTVDVTVELDGAVYLEAYCSNSSGTGRAATATAYAGDVPALPHGPRNLTLVEDTEKWGRTYLSWDAPETDVNEKPIKPEDVVYWIVDNDLSQRYTDFPGTSLIHDKGDLSAMQAFESIMGLAGTRIDGSYQYNWNEPASTPLQSIGRPYDIPFRDAITSSGFKYNWIMNASPSYGHWHLWNGISTDKYTIMPFENDGGMVVFQAECDDAISELRSGKINLGNAAHPSLFFQLYRRHVVPDLCGVVIVDAETLEGTLVYTTTDGASEDEEEGWYTIQVPLDDYKGKVVQVGIMSSCKTKGTYMAFDNFEIRNCLDEDLGITEFSTPYQLLPGRETSFGVKLRNWGVNNTGEYSVSLYRNDNVVETRKFDSLESGAVQTIIFSETPSPLYENLNEYCVKVDYDRDLDMSNNISKAITVPLVQFEYPVPTGLTGEENGNDVNLSWVEPDLFPSGSITEGFDTYDGFIIDNIGNWTVVDADKNDTYYIENPDGENYPYYGKPQAWQVFNNSYFPYEVIAPHSGSQFIISFTSMKDNDDWLISPRLSGNTQKIRFYARSLDQDDRDSFEVLYSTSDTDIESFISVDRRNSINAFWTPYEFTLPEGAEFFAIRHVGSYDDSFALIIDDITYESAGFDYLTLTGFNIYRDGIKVNGEAHTEFEFTDKDAASADHTYHVSAVYAEGESMASDPYMFASSGLDSAIAESDIRIISREGEITVVGSGQTVEVFDVAGTEIARAEANPECTFRIGKGIYLIKVGTLCAKVVVR